MSEVFFPSDLGGGYLAVNWTTCRTWKKRMMDKECTGMAELLGRNLDGLHKIG